MTPEPTAPRAWSDDDLAADPHAAPDKPRRVERMFASIAHAYDLNNRVHSLGLDQAWRRATVRMAQLSPSDVVLDVACGTGDLAMAFADAAARRIVAVDFTLAMLQRAVTKRRDAQPITYHAGDAMQLPIADAAVDVVSIAFGIRNVADPSAALREFHRVLRPGGRLVVLEFSQPSNPIIRAVDRLYREQIMPVSATWIAGDRSGAYRYLPRSVSTFLDRGAMKRAMEQAGFHDIAQRSLTFGIAVCYRGTKPQ